MRVWPSSLLVITVEAVVWLKTVSEHYRTTKPTYFIAMTKYSVFFYPGIGEGVAKTSTIVVP